MLYKYIQADLPKQGEEDGPLSLLKQCILNEMAFVG
jgi:hypothetical protein